MALTFRALWKWLRGALLLGFVLIVTSLSSRAVEHPGTLPKDAECSSCHVKKITGTSVHSAMAMPCTVCHVPNTQGDMTILTLLMTKDKICFACHQESTAMRQHVPAVRGNCVECHDAHSSDRRMLLREAGREPLSALKIAQK
jgi:predicted CXXCH cytochrome family protein